MKVFSASFDKIIIRYYLLMGVIILAFFANIPWLALLAFPIFMSAILAIDFKPNKKNNSGVQNIKIVTDGNDYDSKEAA